MDRKEYTDEFEQFWKAWPGRWDAKNDSIRKVGKHDAYVEWLKIPAARRKAILEVVVSGKVKRAGTQYLQDAHRWLKHKRFDDFL